MAMLKLARQVRKNQALATKKRLTKGGAVVRAHLRQPNVKEQGKLVNFHSDRPILAENPIKNRPINARTI